MLEIDGESEGEKERGTAGAQEKAAACGVLSTAGNTERQMRFGKCGCILECHQRDQDPFAEICGGVNKPSRVLHVL